MHNIHNIAFVLKSVEGFSTLMTTQMSHIPLPGDYCLIKDEFCIVRVIVHAGNTVNLIVEISNNEYRTAVPSLQGGSIDQTSFH